MTTDMERGSGNIWFEETQQHREELVQQAIGIGIYSEKRDWSEECTLVIFKALVVLKTWSDKALAKWLILTKLISKENG